MTYKPPRVFHKMTVTPLFTGARYVTCTEPGCSRVRRAWGMKPLIHKGGRPRR